MQRTSILLVKYGGQVPFSNVPKDYQGAIKTAEKTLETKYTKIAEGRIQGSVPHKSSKDKTDDKNVITVSYHTAKGTRITSIHAHDDNTFKEFPSRNADKGK